MKKPNTTFGILIILLLTFISIDPIPAFGQVSRRERTLYAALSGQLTDPTNINIFTPGGNKGNQGVWGLVYEHLIYYNFWTGEFIPWLATDLKYSDNYTKLTVYLRKGVKWSDGYDFTADDVVFTYQMLLNNSKLVFASEVQAAVKSVRKIDDYTAEITLKESLPYFHYNGQRFSCMATAPCMYTVPRHIWKNVDPQTYKDSPPIGTGPYNLTYITQNGIIYERRDDWWATKELGIRPAPERIIYEYYSTHDSLSSALAANQVDACLSYLNIPPALFEKARNLNPNIIAWYKTLPYSAPTTVHVGMYLNNMKYPWSLKEVRHAINYLIDRNMVAEIAGERAITPAYVPFSYKLKPALPFYEAIQPLVKKYEIDKTDKAKAEAIFMSLNFTKGSDGIWVTPNGTRVGGIIITGTDDIYIKAATVLVEQLRAGGIEITHKMETGTVGVDKVNRGEFDFYMDWMSGIVPSRATMLLQFHSKYCVPIGQSAPSTRVNSVRFRHATFDAIVDDIERLLPDDINRQVSLFTKAMDVFYAELPEIPIFYHDKLVALNTYYWSGWPASDNDYYVTSCIHWPFLLFVLVGYKSPNTGQWIGGLRPSKIDYAVTYFTSDTSTFKGIDQVWYGPFKKGDAANIPVDDAEFLIKRKLASFTPPATGISPELVQAFSGLKTSFEEASKSVQVEVRSLNAQIGTLTAATAIEGIAIVVLAIALVIMVRKK